MNVESPNPVPESPEHRPTPLEVRAEPARPEDRTASIDAPAFGSGVGPASASSAPLHPSASSPAASNPAPSKPVTPNAPPFGPASATAPPPNFTFAGGAGHGGNAGGAASKDAGPSARNYAWPMACHLVGVIDFGFAFLFVGIIATTAVWLMKKDEDAEVEFHGKEALNFQLNVLFWQMAAVPLLLCLIGLPLGFALPFVKVVLMLVAALRAANGERWKYPLIYRVLR